MKLIFRISEDGSELSEYLLYFTRLLLFVEFTHSIVPDWLYDGKLP